MVTASKVIAVRQERGVKFIKDSRVLRVDKDYATSNIRHAICGWSQNKGSTKIWRVGGGGRGGATQFQETADTLTSELDLNKIVQQQRQQESLRKFLHHQPRNLLRSR